MGDRPDGPCLSLPPNPVRTLQALPPMQSGGACRGPLNAGLPWPGFEPPSGRGSEPPSARGSEPPNGRKKHYNRPGTEPRVVGGLNPLRLVRTYCRALRPPETHACRQGFRAVDRSPKPNRFSLNQQLVLPNSKYYPQKHSAPPFQSY